MQRVKQEYFKDRCLYYTSSLISEQAPKGAPKWDYQLKPVYLIGIMDFTFDVVTPDMYVHHVQLVNTDSNEIFYDKLTYVYVEVPKFLKQEEELSSELENWLFLLKNMSKLDKIPVVLRKPIFSTLFDIAEISNLTGKEKMAYDASLKEKWDNYSTMTYAISEGRKEGMKEGEKHGKLAGQKKIAAAMKKKGLETSLIKELTSLSAEEIEKL